MKQICLALLVVSMIQVSVLPQAGWFWQNPLPTGNDYTTTFFISEYTGWIAGAAGTILKTTDGGNSWIDQSVFAFNFCRYIQFVSEQTGWVLIGDLLKTTDGGNSWSEQTQNEFFYSAFFIDSAVGWLISDRVLKTTDGGNTWVEQYYDPNLGQGLIKFINESHGFILGLDYSSNQQIFLKTSDGGANWTYSSINLPTNISLYTLEFLDANNGFIAGLDINTVSGVIYKTTDGGVSWFQQYTGPPSSFFTSIEFIDSLVGWTCGGFGTVVKTTDGGNDWFIQTTGNFFTSYLFSSFVNADFGISVGDRATILKTTDGGQNWSNRTSGFTDYLYGIDAYSENLAWAVGGINGKIFRTSDGGNNWEVVNTGISASFSSIYFITPNIGWACSGGGYIINSTDGGISWQFQYNNSSSSFRDVLFLNTSIGFAIGGNGKILKTTNGGINWVTKTSGTGEQLLSIFFIDSLTGWIGGSHGTMLKTSDSGESWSQIILNSQFNCQSIYFNDNSTGWCVGMDDDRTLATVYKSTNGGSNWDIQFSDPGGSFNSVDFIDLFNGMIVGDHMFYTTNSGNNWIEMPQITLNFLNDIEFVDNSLVGWIVGGNGTILKTTDGGGVLPVELLKFEASVNANLVDLSWSTVSETNNHGFEIERNLIKDDVEGDWLLIGFVKGNGSTTEKHSYNYVDNIQDINVSTMRYRLKQVDYNGTFEYSDEVEISVLPEDFKLFQNYPNPFNPSTIISWQVPVGSWLTFKIYDVLGNEVATLVDEYKSAGSYEVEWGATGLPSGVYFYQLKTEGFVETKKMMLMK